MMDYRQEYEKKLITPEQAAAMVKPGDVVELYGYNSSGQALDKALAARAGELERVSIRTMVSRRDWQTFLSDPEGKSFIDDSPFLGPRELASTNNWNRVANPALLYEYPLIYRRGDWPTDFGSVMVSPPDKDGFMYFTFAAAYTKAISEGVKCFMPEVNERFYPLVNFHQDARVHISEVPYIIKGDSPEHAVRPPVTYGENEKKIAELVYMEMCDGCCIQIGTGGVPAAIAAVLSDSDLKDLGVHTEFLSDSVMMLERKGLINGSRKSLQKGLMTTSILNGTAEFMEYLEDNIGKFYMAPSDYVNDPYVVGQLDNFISVNGCLEIDLQGHVNSESIQTRQISGTGGQLDFMLGAYRSKGGKSILCCNSTYKKKDGTAASKIHAALPSGACCTVPRSAVQYVCTEQGIVNLKGKNIWQRAEAVISIAHPDFRDGLIVEAEKTGIWKPSNKR